MKNELLLSFENYLYQEAERILLEITKKDKQEIDSITGKIIKTQIKGDLTNYWLDIEFKVKRMLLTPETLSSKNNLINSKEQQKIEKQLLKYSEWCKEENDKDHEFAANKIALDLINYCKYNPTSKKGLAELIYEYMPIYLDGHYDSTDSKVIMLYLQNALKQRGYSPASLKPFRLMPI